MKILVIARHGRRGDNGHLNPKGAQETDVLGARLKPILAGRSVIIFASPSPRAHESADVLSSALDNAPVEVGGVFKYGTFNDECHAIFGLRERAECVVVVAHLEEVTSLPKIISKLLKWSEPVDEKELGYGCATVMDLEAQSYQRLE